MTTSRGTLTDEAAEAAKDSTINVKDLQLMLSSVSGDATVPDRRARTQRVGHREHPRPTLIPAASHGRSDALATLPQDKQVVLHLQDRRAFCGGAGAGQGRRLLADAVHVGGRCCRGPTNWKPESLSSARGIDEAL